MRSVVAWSVGSSWRLPSLRLHASIHRVMVRSFLFLCIGLICCLSDVEPATLAVERRLLHADTAPRGLQRLSRGGFRLHPARPCARRVAARARPLRNRHECGGPPCPRGAGPHCRRHAAAAVVVPRGESHALCSHGQSAWQTLFQLDADTEPTPIRRPSSLCPHRFAIVLFLHLVCGRSVFVQAHFAELLSNNATLTSLDLG